ncbi:Clathrin light chain [Sporothrix stenoceras]|uniref:Clathrin light chain n=1 Tax=Sporothrix stenoceras TaxID=5173 RepID=A0ABR3ZHZ5_9PEZI
MADRFPSLEDFDSGAQTDVKDTNIEASSDDFLARERAILGDDANQFTTPGDSAAFETSGGDDNLLGGDSAETAQFESSFPDLAAQEQTSSTTITGGPSVNFNSGYQATVEDEEEPEVIKAWREKRDEQNAKRAQQFAQQREETIAEAQRNIDDFYENYNNKRDKLVSATQKEAETFLNNRDDVTSGGTSWERIAKIVDVSGKGAKGGAAGSGKERFRELLMSLRKDEKAPGAEGY